MSILARIRAHDGDVVRDEWRFALKRGRLSSDALAWLRERWSEVCREAWPQFDEWAERAAIREHDGGQPRAEAEKAAYQEVKPC